MRVPNLLVPTSAAHPGLGLLCLSSSLGGLELNTIKFSHWLQERGWPVTLFLLPAAPMAAWAAREAIPLREVCASRRKSLAVSAAQLMAQQLRELGIRVLIVTQNQDLGLVLLLKTLLGKAIRIIYQQHMQLGPAKRDWFHTLRFRIIDRWLAPLPGLARQVTEKTHYDPSRLRTVPLGIELAQFLEPGLTPAAARTALQLPPAGPLLGLLGRFDVGKGQDFVVRVLHQLRTGQGIPAQLVLMGEATHNEGPAYVEYVHEKVRELGLEPYVHFRPFRPDTAVFYQAIDVFVQASANETYGMVTIEAMAAGKPVVASATGGTVEIVDDGRTGLLYPLGDVAGCARRVAQCLQEPPLARSLAAAARLEARQRFSHEQQCRLTEAAIEEVL